MKKRIPSFLAGVITTLLIFTLSVTALAASGKITLEVSPINVLVNGEEFKPKDAQGNNVLVFVYNGTTYAPLRALAESYGLQVGYDSERGIATVNSTSSPATTSVPKLSNISYDEFKNSLSYKTEIGDLLTAPSSKGVSYHYYLTFGEDLNEVEFLKEWETFSNSDIANDYLTRLTQEYSQKAPYNIVSLHIWYNDRELKCLTV